MRLQATWKQKTKYSIRSKKKSETHQRIKRCLWTTPSCALMKMRLDLPAPALLSFIPCDVFDGWQLWSAPGSAGTLMSTCGRPVEAELPGDGGKKTLTLQSQGDHPGIPLLLCQSLSCLVATCTICVSTWATAEWQLPSENMAHDVNARRACGLRKRRSWPSLFPPSSVTAEAGVMALSSPKNLFADIPSFCHTAKRRWQSDWRRRKRRRTSGWLTFDGCVRWRTQWNLLFFLNVSHLSAAGESGCSCFEGVPIQPLTFSRRLMWFGSLWTTILITVMSSFPSNHLSNKERKTTLIFTQLKRQYASKRNTYQCLTGEAEVSMSDSQLQVTKSDRQQWGNKPGNN